MDETYDDDDDAADSRAGTKLGFTIFAGLLTLIAGAAARKAAHVGWRAVTGKHPPDKPEALGASWAELVGWTAVSGTAIALARVLATRKAAAIWERSTGSAPPGAPTTPTSTPS